MRNELEQEIHDGMRETMALALAEGGRERIKDRLQNWISFTARKKQTPDLPQRLEIFRKRIEDLAESLSLDLGPYGVVVKAAGDSETTLRQLMRGTDWFDPAGDVTEMIMSSVFKSV